MTQTSGTCRADRDGTGVLPMPHNFWTAIAARFNKNEAILNEGVEELWAELVANGLFADD
jgi:hypothetical protein